MKTMRLPDGVVTRHHWQRVQKPWAFRAWRRRNPEEAARVNERFGQENKKNEDKDKKTAGRTRF